MWRAFEPDGRLVYPDFIETVIRIVPLYWVRLVAALLFFSGLLLLVWNIVKTIKSAPADFAVEPEVSAPPLVKDLSAPGAVTPANTYDHALYRLQHALRHGIHRALEGAHGALHRPRRCWPWPSARSSRRSRCSSTRGT